MPDLLDAVGEFCASDHFRFLDASVKQHAEQLLVHWCTTVADRDIDVIVIEQSLSAMARLDVPVDARKALPGLLCGFFDYMSSSGRAPQAASWIDLVSLVEPRFAGSFRDDGTVRGATFAKKYTDVGRNDPCPCGSGKKFKKCCMETIQ
jgi:hypothetical protein